MQLEFPPLPANEVSHVALGAVSPFPVGTDEDGRGTGVLILDRAMGSGSTDRTASVHGNEHSNAADDTARRQRACSLTVFLHSQKEKQLYNTLKPTVSSEPDETSSYCVFCPCTAVWSRVASAQTVALGTAALQRTG